MNSKRVRQATIALVLVFQATGASAQAVSLPAVVLPGEPIRVTVSGVTPREEVTIVAEKGIAQGGQVSWFASQATFLSGTSGDIDVSDAQPIGGDYRGNDPSGLFWAMRPVREKPAELAPNILRITVRAGGNTIAQAEAQIADRDPRVEHIAVPAFPGAEMWRPKDALRRPVVLILGGSEGGGVTGRALGPVFAAKGYVALSVPYYSPDWGGGREIEALPEGFVDIPVDRLEAVRAWILAQPNLDADRIGLYGVSKGAEFALLAASRFPWLKAVAAIVPTDVVWEGFGAGAAPDTRSSFSWRGQPLSWVPYEAIQPMINDLFKGRVRRLRLAHDEGRQRNPDRVEAAQIPIEQYRGPLLVAGGDLDGTWASGTMARAVAARRKTQGLETTLLTFDRAGHAINGSGWEPLNYPGLDSDPGALAHAQRQVRKATLELFGRVLAPQPLPGSATTGAVAR